MELVMSEQEKFEIIGERQNEYVNSFINMALKISKADVVTEEMYNEMIRTKEISEFLMMSMHLMMQMQQQQQRQSGLVVPGPNISQF